MRLHKATDDFNKMVLPCTFSKHIFSSNYYTIIIGLVRHVEQVTWHLPGYHGGSQWPPTCIVHLLGHIRGFTFFGL